MILDQTIGQDGYVWDVVTTLTVTSGADLDIAADNQFEVVVDCYCQETAEVVARFGKYEQIKDASDPEQPEWHTVVWRGFDLHDAIRAYDYFVLRVGEKC